MRLAALFVIAAFWLGLFVYIWAYNARARRPEHTISWVELTLLPVLALVALWGLDRFQPLLGDFVVGGLHVVGAGVALYAHLRQDRSLDS